MSPTATAPKESLSKAASIPFFIVHALLLLAPLVGVSWELVGVAFLSYYLRMIAVTMGYHRYFAHRTFQTNRVFQFLLAFAAQTTAQKGALWWAAHHRHHHRESDTALDVHSPTQKGFFWSHVGWILSSKYDETNYAAIKDFARFPELVWLNKNHLVPFVAFLGALFLMGGVPYLFWGGIVGTIVCWHLTFTINSLSHIFGKRRYITTDTSRNNWLLALLTCGEGWHNNHHYHQNTANQGWFWWEVDVTFYVLKALSLVGVVSKLRLPSDATKFSFRNYSAAQRAQLSAEAKFDMHRRSATPEPMLGLGAPSPVPMLKQ